MKISGSVATMVMESIFKEIGEKLEPFDFAFMECGQYNDDWHLILLFPEERIQAAMDANVQNPNAKPACSKQVPIM